MLKNELPAGTSSATLGANTEVAVTTAQIASGPPCWLTTSSRLCVSVLSSSPCFTKLMMTGSRPAVKMALKQDFWSTRDQMTYLEPGLCLFRAIKHKATPIPVATGATKASLADLKRFFKDILLTHFGWYFGPIIDEVRTYFCRDLDVFRMYFGRNFNVFWTQF